MADLLTSAQMRAIEAAAIDSGAVTGLELMERAGEGVVGAVLAEWPELGQGAHSAAVLCGPGNNGGDGFVVARLLARLGWAVAVYLCGDPDRLPPDARANYERWAEIGAVTRFDCDRWPGYEFQSDLLIDALFGTGLKRPFGGAEDLRHSMMEARDNFFAGPRSPRLVAVVAVDIPSGLCADSGRQLVPEGASGEAGEVLEADLTVTFHARKPGHVLADGPALCGKVVVTDIGLDAAPHSAAVRAVAAPAPQSLDKSRAHGGHKYTHGHALILSGATGHTGAARLAARAALRVGAGLVTLGTPHAALAENAAQLTAIMLAEVDDGATLARLLADKRLNALALGPGLGPDRARDLVPVALAARRATVLDADALTAFADTSPALFAQLHKDCVLTPHGGEFARLFPDIAERLAAPATSGPAYSKLDATREAAARAGCTILFKGPDTVIAGPDGRAAVHAAAYERAAPWLATAGSGDVLTGMIAGLMARGFAPMKAAETAAWLHVEAARGFGPGLIAEDLPEALPGVFRSLGL